MKLDRWQIVSYISLFINPIIGIILGIALYTDEKSKEHRETGKYVIILSILMIMIWTMTLKSF